MNERDYYIIENLFLMLSILFFIFGVYLLQAFRLENLFNTIFLFIVFILLFCVSVFYRYKRQKHNDEVLNEIKKYMDEIRNE